MALVPFDEARAVVLAGCEPLPVEGWLPSGAVGAVLAEDVVAGEDIPPFANSAMDGFAVRAADVAGATETEPAVLTIVAEIKAGDPGDVSLGPGEAIRIMTGAPVPDGADAVVMVERTATADDGATVEVLVEVPPGNSVRPAGDDIASGQTVFRAGEVISPGHVGVLASLGITSVAVRSRPRVGVLSTGDELVEPGVELQRGQIRDSNRVTLLTLLRESGFPVEDLGHAPDDEQAIADAFGRASWSCDAVLTTGGVSMGDYDFVKVVLDRIGDMRWLQIAIKPAKPLAFGTIAGVAGKDGRRIPVFGLPGNPVSSTVSFELFARPGLRKLMGHADGDLDRPRVQAIADEPLRRRPDGKIHFARVVARYADGAYHVTSAGGQGSHQLSAMAHANALAILPDGDAIEAGGAVDVLLLDGARR